MDYQKVPDPSETTMVPISMIAAARREGVIEGLERALGLMAAWNPQGAIRAELERLKAEG